PSAAGLCDLAWPLVEPKRNVFGGEARGLALAQHAAEHVEDEEDAVRASQVLAWALFANGATSAAFGELRSALSTSSGPAKTELEQVLDRMQREDSSIRAEIAGLPALEARVVELEKSIWRFDSPDDRWWHIQLVKLIGRLEELGDPETGLINGISPEHGWGI